MRYAGREYRVVCTKSADKQLMIDIVPANSALHRLILQERQQRNGYTKAVAGSISLYDMGEGNKPEILFLPPDNGGLAAVELSGAEENMLRHKIAARFEEMMAQNQESTITVRPEVHRNYVLGIINQIRASSDADYTAKSWQEEQNIIQKEREKKSAATRAQTAEYLRHRDEKYSKYGVLALQIRQLIQRDY